MEIQLQICYILSFLVFISLNFQKQSEICNEISQKYTWCTMFVLKEVWVYFDHLLNYREGIKKCKIQKTFKLPWLN